MERPRAFRRVLAGALLTGLALWPGLPGRARAQVPPASVPDRAGFDRSIAREGRPAFAGVKEPELRRGLFEQWKATRQDEAGRIHGVTREAIEVFSTAVGRASMAINGSGTIVYTRQTPGSSCDPDPAACGAGGQINCSVWSANTPFAAGKIVEATGGSQGSYYGLLFQAQAAGTSGGAEPSWPILAGGTVSGDGTMTWTAIGFDPATLSGCSAMQIVSRASGGLETVIASEGDALADGSQLSGWGEFTAFSDSGVAAFKAAQVGRPIEPDEGRSVIMTAGPGAGSLTRIADSPVTIGGHDIFGYSSMVGMNNAGQVVFDGYAREKSTPLWRGLTAYGAGTRVQPTSGTPLLQFRSTAAGTSGALEPVWPVAVGQTVVDGSMTWRAEIDDADENNHTLIRYTPGVGNEVLIGQGDFVPPDFSVDGFGDDDNSGGGCINIFTDGSCEYDNFDGRINSSGHVPVVITSNGDQIAYLLLGPGSNTEAARSGGAGPGGIFGTIFPRIAINDADQMVFLAQVGGVKKLLRWTPPSTLAVVASVGDDIGTRSGGSASGVTITNIGFFADINNPGNVVFQATLGGGPNPLGFFFWKGATGLLSTITTGGNFVGCPGVGAGFFGLASEMITINDSDLVAFLNGSCSPETNDGEASEDIEKGLFFWTIGGGAVKALASGDVVTGNTVTNVYAQHTSFVKRQLNSAGCVALRYFISGQRGDFDEEEGSGALNVGTPPGGQLFSSCGSICNAPAAPVLGLAPPSAPVGANVVLTWTNTLPAGQGTYDIIRSIAGSPTTIASGIPASASSSMSFNYTVVGPAGAQDFQVKAIPNCNPALASLSNTARLTVTGCAKSAPPPVLIVDKPIVPADGIVTLTWDSPSPGFPGTYTVKFSTDGGANFQDFASGITGNQFAFRALFPVGTTIILEVVADPGCGPAGVSDPSPTVSVMVVQACPRAGEPVAVVDQAQVAVGDHWSLHWTATLPVVGGVTAGIYEVRISQDGGATFHVAGTTAGTTFTGGPVPQEDQGKLIFLQVIAKPSCGTGGLSDGASNVVFFSVLAGCEASNAATNVSIAAAGISPTRPPSPIEYILTSWLGPASGPVPRRYGVRINGDPEVLTTFTSLILAPRGSGDPITAFVTAYTCGTLISAEIFAGAGPWSPTGSLVVPRQSHTATLLTGGNVLVAGGTSTPFGPALVGAELFDPGAGGWSPTGNLVTARQSHTATALTNGKVLVSGGVSAGLSASGIFQSVAEDILAGGQLSSAELYDPAAKTWSSTGDLGTARAQHTATLLPNGKVLVAGGRGGGPLNAAELFEPTTGLWSSTGPLQTARLAHTATLLLNGKVLIAGGVSASGVLASAELYDPATGAWTLTGSLGTAREGQTATLLSSGKVLVSGGDDGGVALKGAELYDPAAGTWSATGNLGTARTLHTATRLPSGAVLAAGGSVLHGLSLKSTELYDPAAGTWSATGSLNGAHGLHSATLLSSGSVLVAGLPDSIGSERASPIAQSATVALFLTPPGTDFTISPNPVVGQPVTFTDTSNPQATGWLWIFDDGATDSHQSPTHVFSRAGTHTVALDATNGAGSQTKVKSFVVSAGAAATASRSESIPFDASDPIRQRATVTLGAQGSTWLHVRMGETQDTTLFLRFIRNGALVTERRLVVSPGSEAVYDLAAWSLNGTFSLELVCDRSFSAWIVRSGRPGTREVTR